jgi:hypothetical protein
MKRELGRRIVVADGEVVAPPTRAPFEPLGQQVLVIQLSVKHSVRAGALVLCSEVSRPRPLAGGAPRPSQRKPRPEARERSAPHAHARHALAIRRSGAASAAHPGVPLLVDLAQADALAHGG